jgi:hypothetical protein
MQPICGAPVRDASPTPIPGAPATNPISWWQPSCQRRQDQVIGWVQPWLFGCPAENAQLMAKAKEFNLMIDATDLEHEHIEDEARAAIDAT